MIYGGINVVDHHLKMPKAGNIKKANFKKFDIKKFNIKDISNLNSGMKKILIVFMIAVIGVLSFTAYKVNEIKTRAFSFYLDGQEIGAVRSEEEALSVMNQIKKEISATYDVTSVLANEFLLEPTHAKDSELIPLSELKTSIKSNINFLVSGYSLVIEGQEVGILKSGKETESILEEIKAPYIENIEGTLKEINFLEDIQIAKNEVSIDSISERDKLVEVIRIGTDEIKTHTVEVGESFWTIAKIYDIDVENLVDANPEADPLKLKPGDEVNLVIPTSMLTVETIVQKEYTENTPYEIIVEEDPSLYTNQKKVKVEGKEGLSKVVADETKHNGVLVDKNIISEEILEEPVTQVVIQGTKELPKTAATGKLMMPTRGRFTSGYGHRWGRMHRGIDIAAKTGTPIVAADGGTVIKSGWHGTFGNMIEIDHGNGMVTRYAHASKLLVSRGAKVYKGQHIANVGNTGRSTGAHLHLEVLINGVNVNPSKYVK